MNYKEYLFQKALLKSLLDEKIITEDEYNKAIKILSKQFKDKEK